jgi:hypothetical protein
MAGLAGQPKRPTGSGSIDKKQPTKIAARPAPAPGVSLPCGGHFSYTNSIWKGNGVSSGPWGGIALSDRSTTPRSVNLHRFTPRQISAGSQASIAHRGSDLGPPLEPFVPDEVIIGWVLPIRGRPLYGGGSPWADFRTLPWYDQGPSGADPCGYSRFSFEIRPAAGLS